MNVLCTCTRSPSSGVAAQPWYPPFLTTNTATFGATVRAPRSTSSSNSSRVTAARRPTRTPARCGGGVGGWGGHGRRPGDERRDRRRRVDPRDDALLDDRSKARGIERVALAE